MSLTLIGKSAWATAFIGNEESLLKFLVVKIITDISQTCNLISLVLEKLNDRSLQRPIYIYC